MRALTTTILELLGLLLINAAATLHVAEQYGLPLALGTCGALMLIASLAIVHGGQVLSAVGRSVSRTRKRTLVIPRAVVAKVRKR